MVGLPQAGPPLKVCWLPLEENPLGAKGSPQAAQIGLLAAQGGSTRGLGKKVVHVSALSGIERSVFKVGKVVNPRGSLRPLPRLPLEKVPPPRPGHLVVWFSALG